MELFFCPKITASSRPLEFWRGSPDPFFMQQNEPSQESAKGAGGKGARVINCHNFFFTPDTVRETRRIDHTTTEGTAERKMRQFATPAPFTPAPFRPF